MKKFLVILLLLIGFAKAEIKWYNYQEGLKEAQKSNKLIFIYIYSPSCHYCDIMDFKVFESDRVENLLNQYFIPIKVRKCSKEGIEIRNKYGFTGTPMFYFLEPDGKKIKTIFGAWEEKDFVKILEYFAYGYYKKMDMTEYFSK